MKIKLIVLLQFYICTLFSQELVSIYDLNTWHDNLTIFKGKLIYTACMSGYGYQIFQYDGIHAPIVYIDSSGRTSYSPEFLTEFHDKLFYSKYSTLDHERNLWYFDGINQPRRVTDLYPGMQDSIIMAPYNLTVVNDKLYWSSFISNMGWRLGNYDGIHPPSVILKIADTLRSNYPQYIFSYQDKVYFEVNDGSYKMTLWEWDEINKPKVILDSLDNQNFYVYNKILYIIRNNELWKYNGIDSPEKICNLGSIHRLFNDLIGFNNKLYFNKNDSIHGTELWVYDGINSPSMVYDINQGTNGSDLRSKTIFNDKLIFSASDGQHSGELWEYDGINSPILIKYFEIPYDGYGHNLMPEKFTIVTDSLYFIVFNKLWRYDGISSAVQLVNAPFDYGRRIPQYPKLKGFNNLLYIVTYDSKTDLSYFCNSCHGIEEFECDSLYFNDRYLTKSGTYCDTLIDSHGNDSIIILKLTIPNKYSTRNTSSCDAFYYNGKILTQSGIYYDTIINGKTGCTNFETLNLTIKNSKASIIAPTVCDRYTSPSGKNLYVSGVYRDTIPNSAGCDSLITINLTVNHNSKATLQPKVCNSYTSPSGKYVWEQSGTFLDTIPNFCGCDSVITIELNISNVDPTIITDGAELISNDTLAHHQWLVCDDDFKPIAGETGQSFKPDKEGNYAVIVSYGWCADTSECVQINTTGIEPNPVEFGITVYPNPTSGKFTIDLGRVYQEAVITITELDGRWILNQKIENSRILNMDLNRLNGIYLINITTEHFNRVYRIVKE